MPNRSSKRQETDPNVSAFNAVQRIIAVSEERATAPEPLKDPLAVELGRRGGLKGGKARAAKLSAKRRREIASKAAKTRWKSTRRTSQA